MRANRFVRRCIQLWVMLSALFVTCAVKSSYKREVLHRIQWTEFTLCIMANIRFWTEHRNGSGNSSQVCWGGKKKEIQQVMGTVTQKQGIALVQRVCKQAAGIQTLSQSQSQSLDPDLMLFGSAGWNISASSLGAKTSFWLFSVWSDPLLGEEQWSLKEFNCCCLTYLIEPLWNKHGGLNINPLGLN